LRKALLERPADRKWVIAHIPPGIDAYSTTLARELVVVPFLDQAPRQQSLRLLSAPRSHVALVLAAHTHKFAYRIAGEEGANPVAMLLIPSISPIFRNSPSFLTVNVRSDGVITNADDHAFIPSSTATGE
jgi:hypothetical protein